MTNSPQQQQQQQQQGSPQGIKRLQKEYAALQRTPVPHFLCMPSPSNLLDCHFVLMGPSGTPYENGFYHGRLVFPETYPFKPPSIMMITPNGRFQVNERLCLSMSDFHPETWNPMWSVGSILVGLLSFMLEDQHSVGSIVTTEQEKRAFAKRSLEYNRRNPRFMQLFNAQVLEILRERDRLQQATAGATDQENNVAAPQSPSQPTSLSNVAHIFVVLVILLAILWWLTM